MKKTENETLARLSEKSRTALARFREDLAHFLTGKEVTIDAICCAIFSSGHILLEDVPGVGKTTIIKAVSRLLGLEMKRIQCTSDLLPSDVIGVEIFNTATQEFVFHPGPLFSNIILADELNRASPRTQSALLEAMGEGLVTVDRKTYALPKPFIVFAAQNPSDHLGTYALPESQLDRFAVKLQLGYPERQKEKEIFSQAALDPLADFKGSAIAPDSLYEIQAVVDRVFISEKISSYVKRFVDESRRLDSLKLGVSTRGGVSWLRMARAKAVLAGRDFVTPDDLLALAVACLGHRVVGSAGGEGSSVIEQLTRTVAID